MSIEQERTEAYAMLNSLSKVLGGIAVEAIQKYIYSLEAMPNNLQKLDDPRIRKALEIVQIAGMTDGSHHKQWGLDQIARVLTQQEYELWVKAVEIGDDGPHTFNWDIGVAP